MYAPNERNTLIALVSFARVLINAGLWGPVHGDGTVLCVTLDPVIPIKEKGCLAVVM